MYPDKGPRLRTQPQTLVASFKQGFSSFKAFRIEILAGLATAFALIPEVISFAILAGVSPTVGLFSTVVLCLVIAFTGGRPAMITGAAGATALVIAPLVKSHGVDYLILTVILAGIIQVIVGVAGIAKLQKYISRPVMAGFVNALGIMIFAAQVEHLFDVPWMVWVLFALGVGIVLWWPKVTTVFPAPLMTIAVLTAVVVAVGWKVPDVGDMGGLSGQMPDLTLPDIPLNFETLWIILPYSLGFAAVGLVESVMTAQLVDDMTGTDSNKTRESWGLGIANMLAGFIGGTGGCGMIGQTMVNVGEAKARTRLSSIAAGIFLLLFIFTLNDVVGLIPMAALVAIMVVVSLRTIDWGSVSPRGLMKNQWQYSLIMVVTVVGTLVTENLAVGVVAGVILTVILKRFIDAKPD